MERKKIRGAPLLIRLTMAMLLAATFFVIRAYSAMEPAQSPSASSGSSSYKGDPKEEWKHWQKKFNEQMAAKEVTERKKKKWLEKEFEIKEVVIGDIKVAGIPGMDGSVIKLKDVSGMNVNKDDKVVERCLTCHDGVEQISAFHPVNQFGCTICHRGNGESVVKEEAHKNMLYGQASMGGKRNPSNFRVVDKSCALSGCHAGHRQDDINHWPRLSKTMMSLQAGKIAAIRFQWAAQPGKEAKYATVGVKDEDGFTPTHRGALKSIGTLPVFSPKDLPLNDDGSFNHQDDMGNPIEVSREIADSQWRKSCGRCHFWVDRNDTDHNASADYRAQGCASCHVLYDDDGKYKGNDPTIPKDKSGHPKVHQVTTAIPATQCIHCHNRGGRTGTSFEGRVESDFYGTPFDKGGQSKLKFHGKYYNTLTMDIHYEKGLECIDCHTQYDVMGDGNIYSKKFEQVEVRCEDCHGNYNEGLKTAKVTKQNDRVVRLSVVSPNYKNKAGDEMVLTARGNKYTNAKIIDGEAILISKFDGREHKMPVITGKKGAHSIPQHQERMDCFSCHSRWVPQCYGCHDYYDQASMSGDRLTMRTDTKKGVKTPGNWPEWRSYVRYLEPALGINAKGKVAPYMPACQVQFNAIDGSGSVIEPFDNFVFATKEGYNPGTVQSSMQPHSMRAEVRTCEDCHLNPKALGLGVGDLLLGRASDGSEDKIDYLYDMAKSGLTPNFPFEVIETPRGQQVTSNSHIGARPFNQKELNRIWRVGTCLPCHDTYEDPIYLNINDSYKKAESPGHKKKIDDLLKSSKTASIEKPKAAVEAKMAAAKKEVAR
ncbi:MAG: hypothetical protein HY808_06530 [Nitrospirae bacterium]|nr:hypothetical protein [Nitrospirota bacterium]